MSDPASLKNLYDIVTPGPVPWWPPAPGWYVIFAIIIIVTAWLGFRRYRDWKANQYRMSALGRLAGIEKELDKMGKGAPALTEIPFLVKHTGLLAFPRKEIAQMSGEPWLEFLDKSYGGEGFTRGPGRMLPKLAYGSSRELQDISAEEINQLTVVLRHWIQDHRSKI